MRQTRVQIFCANTLFREGVIDCVYIFTPDGQRLWSQLVAEYLQDWIQRTRKA